jgi:hypothetical protein
MTMPVKGSRSPRISDYLLKQWIMASLAGVPATGEVKVLCPVDSSTSKFRTALHDLGISYNDMYTSLQSAHDSMADYGGDTLLVLPGSNSAGSSAFTWSKNYSNIVGIATPVINGGRARISLTSINASVALTISARSVMIKNVHFQWGGGNASARTAVKMTYSGNANNILENCDIEMIHATEAAAAYRLLELGSGTQDVQVVGGRIGGWTVTAGEADGYELYLTGNNAVVYCKDVLFQAYSSEAAHYFIGPATGNLGGEAALALFEGCKFFQGDRDVTLTAVCTPHTTQGCYWFVNCSAYNVTDWAAAGSTTVKVSTAAANEAGGIGAQPA